MQETLKVVEGLSDVDISKYVKIFNSDDTTILGMQHPRVKKLAKEKNMKIPNFSLQSKKYPSYVTLKARQFTKMNSVSSHGASNTAPGFCTSVIMKKLASETRSLVAKVLKVQDEELLSSDTEEAEVEIGASQEYPQYSQSQSETLKCCALCSYTSRSKSDFQEHMKIHPRCGICNLVIDSEESLQDHYKVHSTSKCKECSMEVLTSSLQGHIESHLMNKNYRKGLDEMSKKRKICLTKIQ